MDPTRRTKVDKIWNVYMAWHGNDDGKGAVAGIASFGCPHQEDRLD